MKRPRFLKLSSSSILIDLPCYDSVSILLGSASEDKTMRYFVDHKIRMCGKVEDDPLFFVRCNSRLPVSIVTTFIKRQNFNWTRTSTDQLKYSEKTQPWAHAEENLECYWNYQCAVGILICLSDIIETRQRKQCVMSQHPVPASRSLSLHLLHKHTQIDRTFLNFGFNFNRAKICAEDETFQSRSGLTGNSIATELQATHSRWNDSPCEKRWIRWNRMTRHPISVS